MTNPRKMMMAAAGTGGGYTLWLWGDGNSGGTAHGNTTDYSSPVQVGSLIDWVQVGLRKNGGHAVKSDGTLWGWGKGNFGGVGDGSTTDRSSPVQIGSLTTWSQAAGNPNSYSAAAVKTDGTLWSWGKNDVGELGHGGTTDVSSPVQIGSLTNWKEVRWGAYNMSAITTAGTLFTWGNGAAGRLGHGNTTNYSSPVQVGSLTTWATLPDHNGSEHGGAIKTDGTLWLWGENGEGELGQGNTTDRHSPVQVGSATNWSQVSLGPGGTIALTTAGTLWAWGSGYGGWQGQGDSTSRSTATQVGSLTNWAYLSRCFTARVCIAVKTDGALWAWGKNTYGSAGQGNTTAVSSPVQIGSLTSWATRPFGGDNQIGALQTA